LEASTFAGFSREMQANITRGVIPNIDELEQRAIDMTVPPCGGRSAASASEQLQAWAEYHEAVLAQLLRNGPDGVRKGLRKPGTADDQERWLCLIGFTSRIVWLFRDYAARLEDDAPGTDAIARYRSRAAMIQRLAQNEPSLTRFFAEFAADIVRAHAQRPRGGAAQSPGPHGGKAN
jgi:hypothetical protein